MTMLLHLANLLDRTVIHDITTTVLMYLVWLYYWYWYDYDSAVVSCSSYLSFVAIFCLINLIAKNKECSIMLNLNFVLFFVLQSENNSLNILFYHLKFTYRSNILLFHVEFKDCLTISFIQYNLNNVSVFCLIMLYHRIASMLGGCRVLLCVVK